MAIWRRLIPGAGRVKRGAMAKLALWASLALSLSLAMGLAACARHPGAVACAADASTANTPGGPFTLVNQDAQPVDQHVLNGKWSVVFFGYTFCPDFCPTTLTTLGKTMEALGPKAKDVQVLFVTIDPARDTPAQLKSYISSRVFPRNMMGLTGTPAQIAQVAKAYVVYYQQEGTGANYTMDHSTALYLMDPCGKFHGVIADGLTPAQDAKAISEAMAGT